MLLGILVIGPRAQKFTRHQQTGMADYQLDKTINILKYNLITFIVM